MVSKNIINQALDDDVMTDDGIIESAKNTCNYDLNQAADMLCTVSQDEAHMREMFPSYKAQQLSRIFNKPHIA